MYKLVNSDTEAREQAKAMAFWIRNKDIKKGHFLKKVSFCLQEF